MEYLIISFIAGLLTVIAPCVFTLLPVILGSTLTERSWRKPIVIITSLSVSIFIFTLLLKATTTLISVDPMVWKVVSGGILIIFGIITIFPKLWDKLNLKFGLSTKSDEALQKGADKGGIVGDILVGAALGPVFSSCSPTYALILATVLPTSPLVGVINLFVYVLGIALILGVITFFSQKAIAKLKWATKPDGWFKRVIGIVFIIIGIGIISGYDKKLEAYLLDNGLFDPTGIEFQLLESSDNSNSQSNTMDDKNDLDLSIAEPYAAPEIKGITDWINSDPLTLEELQGKVVLIDFWTYSCINCIRTLPYVTDWYEEYKDDGLVVIGVHAPEFAFEKEKANVEDAVKEYEINYPVAMDNDFATWRAYNNRFWPAHYFINREGEVVHTHFGEGEYEHSEKVIRSLLGLEGDQLATEEKAIPIRSGQTAETYLGYARAKKFLNSDEFEADKTVNYSLMPSQTDAWSLNGQWLMTEEHIESQADDAQLRLNFSAKEVYLVMGSDQPANVKVELFNDGNKLNEEVIKASESKLYTVVSLEEFKSGREVLLTVPKGVVMNAFTFGS